MSKQTLFIRVVNGNLDRQCVEGGARVYVGRPSVLGNPFVIGKHGTREEVVRRYRTWLERRIRLGHSDVLHELRRIRGLAEQKPVELSCHCMPVEPCHASVIAEIVKQMPTPELVS